MSGVSEVLQETLRQLADRRRKLEPFVDELAELDIVERDLAKTAQKLAKRGGPSRSSATPVAAANGAGGTHRERVMGVLRQHPKGLAGAKIAELAGIQGSQIYVLLSSMAAGDDRVLEKVGRGFYRLIRDIDGGQVDASLTDEEREELGDRALAD